MHEKSPSLNRPKPWPELEATSAAKNEIGAEVTQLLLGESKATLGGVHVGTPIVRKALLFSFWDGIFSNGSVALNETFGVAAAVSLQASSMAIALMSSLPMLMSSVAQYLLPAWAHPAKGRKHYVLLGIRLQIVFLFLAAFSGWIPNGFAAAGYVAAFVLAAVSTAVTGPFWVAWMGDLIPDTARGRHFAWRSIFFSWAYLSCSLAAGLLARRFDPHTAPWSLFAAIFLIAFAFRSASYQFISGQHEPQSATKPEAFSPFKFRPNRDFMIYCLATGTYQGAAAMSGPFFNVYYLRDLRFDYLTLAICLSTTVLGSITFAGFWGKLSDNFGSSRVLWLSGLLIAFIPIPYLFFENKWAIWLTCFYSGATWGGYNLANFSHLLNATDPRVSGARNNDPHGAAARNLDPYGSDGHARPVHRSHYIAYSSLIVGVIGCAFSLLGGYLATRMPILFTWQLQSLFGLSSLLRLAIFLFLFGKFREYRDALPRRSEEVYMELPGFRMGAGIIRTVFRGLKIQ